MVFRSADQKLSTTDSVYVCLQEQTVSLIHISHNSYNSSLIYTIIIHDRDSSHTGHSFLHIVWHPQTNCEILWRFMTVVISNWNVHTGHLLVFCEGRYSCHQ